MEKIQLDYFPANHAWIAEGTQNFMCNHGPCNAAAQPLQQLNRSMPGLFILFPVGVLQPIPLVVLHGDIASQIAYWLKTSKSFL